MKTFRFGVIGCGLMGNGIAQTAAASGYRTVVLEVDQGLLDRGMAMIEKNLTRAVSKGKLSEEDRDAVMGRIKPTLDLADLKDCDLLIEAIIEDLDEKNALFAELEKLCSATAIFASNTSSLSITQLAAATE